MASGVGTVYLFAAAGFGQRPVGRKLASGGGAACESAAASLVQQPADEGGRGLGRAREYQERPWESPQYKDRRQLLRKSKGKGMRKDKSPRQSKGKSGRVPAWRTDKSPRKGKGKGKGRRVPAWPKNKSMRTAK